MDRSSEIAANLEKVERDIATALAAVGRARSEITLIAVTKNFPVSDIEILYQLGVRDFGENRDQEARAKVADFKRAGIRWHFQGQLQRNKLPSIGSWADLVHSVDDVKYLKGLSDAAGKADRHLHCLIQISLDDETSTGRAGTDLAGAREIISTFESDRESLSGITLAGVMGVAPLGSPAKPAFARLYEVYATLQAEYRPLHILSAGMSGDFVEALQAGATHLRIGSSILGSRGATG